MSIRKTNAMTVEGRALLDYVPQFSWKSEYDLGIPLIDIQHQGLAAAFNSLHFAIIHNFGETMLDPIINTVKEYALSHFMTEELIFEKCRYPDTKQHIEAHNELRELLLTIGQECIFNHDPVPFVHFLEKWLTDHVLGEDRKYRDYLLNFDSGDR